MKDERMRIKFIHSDDEEEFEVLMNEALSRLTRGETVVDIKLQTNPGGWFYALIMIASD